MSSESCRGLTESISLGGKWVESSPEFAQSSASDAARDIVSSKSSSELLNYETMLLAPEEFVIAGEEHMRFSTLCGMQALG